MFRAVVTVLAGYWRPERRFVHGVAHSVGQYPTATASCELAITIVALMGPLAAVYNSICDSWAQFTASSPNCTLSPGRQAGYRTVYLGRLWIDPGGRGRCCPAI